MLSYVRRKFRSETSDNMDSWKSRGGKSQRGEEKKWEDQRGEKVRRKKMQVREKVGKSRFTVFPLICGSRGSKCNLAKAAGAEPCRQMRWKIARHCGAKRISKSKCTKHTNVGALFEVEMSKKVHAVVARSTFPSQNVQNTSFSDHFLTFRCRKSAHWPS